MRQSDTRRILGLAPPSAAVDNRAPHWQAWTPIADKLGEPAQLSTTSKHASKSQPENGWKKKRYEYIVSLVHAHRGTKKYDLMRDL